MPCSTSSIAARAASPLSASAQPWPFGQTIEACQIEGLLQVGKGCLVTEEEQHPGNIGRQLRLLPRAADPFGQKARGGQVVHALAPGTPDEAVETAVHEDRDLAVVVL